MGRLFVAAVVAAVALVMGALVWWPGSEPPRPTSARVLGLNPCEVPTELLRRVWRGYSPTRSGDVLAIEWAPNQFAGVRHSTPFPYTQEVPLILFGPPYVNAGQTSTRPVTVADLAPTFAELLGFDEWPARDGRVLDESLTNEASTPPRLIVTLVWDGGGDNLLNHWPDSWPHLKELMRRSTSYDNATVGSSPSITPSVHSTMGTGAWPKSHGQTDMILRVDDRMEFVWGKLSPRHLELETLGDLWDREHDNEPLVGAMARSSYHLGMLGHGAYSPGGDRDVAVVDQTAGLDFRTNDRYYRLPPYLGAGDAIERAVQVVDRRDGSTDGVWLGNEIAADDPLVRTTPAWPIYQTEQLIEIIDKEGFGADATPDLFYVNYKTTDLAGHRWNLVEPEERDVLREQDRQLPVLFDALDRLVGKGRYVVALTADHGISPYPSTTGGWPIDGAEVVKDIQNAFADDSDDPELVRQNRGYQLFLDPQAQQSLNVQASEVSRFLRNYRIRDNASSGLPPAFEQRGDERVFMTALTPKELKEALNCTKDS